jgi:hypothetical protein
MVKRHILALITALLLASSLIAAEVRLGPEVAVAPNDPDAQADVRIALGPRGAFAVWNDPGRYEVSAAIHGTSMTVDETDAKDWVGWPAVAAGAHGFLVVWRHNVVSNNERVLARRYDFDGNPIDAAPITLDTSPYAGFQFDETPPSIAFDGTAFLVAWTRGFDNSSFGIPHKLYTTRVREDGQPFDARETTFAPGSGLETIRARGPRVLWTGSEFVVIFNIEHSGHAGGPYLDRFLVTIRFDRSYSPLSQTFPFNFRLSSLGVAAPSGSARLTYAGSDDMLNVVVAQTTADGQSLSAPRVIVPHKYSDGTTAEEVVWNGTEHVLVWLDGSPYGSAPAKLFAIRLDTNLEPLDAEPFQIYSEPGFFSNPSLIATPNGVLIAYTRLDSAKGNSPRVFARTLDRLTQQSPHRRPAGR